MFCEEENAQHSRSNAEGRIRPHVHSRRCAWKLQPSKRPLYDLEDRLLEFAANMTELTESLPNSRAGNHVAGQLLRCGTSPLSNHGEVKAAESRKDFLLKLRICLKELPETKRWLRLVGHSKKMGSPVNFTACLNEVEELIRIFVASVRTTERNANDAQRV